jgi:hypothetical protein
MQRSDSLGCFSKPGGPILRILSFLDFNFWKQWPEATNQNSE